MQKLSPGKGRWRPYGGEDPKGEGNGMDNNEE